MSKRRYLPKKTPETNPKIEDVLILYTKAFQKMYIGENYYTTIPRSLINDINNTTKEILWINYHTWKLNAKKLGFEFSDKHSRDFDRISYRDYDFKLNPTDTSLVHLTKPTKAEVLAWLVDNETEERIPAIINANDNFLRGKIHHKKMVQRN